MLKLEQSIYRLMGLGALLLIAAAAAIPAHAESIQDLCGYMDTYNGADAANACIAKMNGKTYDPAAVDVCAYMDTYNGSDAALNCLGLIANQTDDSQALALCKYMDTYSGSDAAISCLKAISGKTFPSGSLDLCQRMATYNGGDAAVTCLQNSGVSKPKPAPAPAQNCPTTANIARGIRASLESLDKYDVLTARKILTVLVTQLESCQ